MKISFEDFWNELTSHELWFEQMKMRFYQKDLKGVANDCYIFLLASEARWKAQDYQDFRRCYQSFLIKSKDMAVKPQLQQAEVKKEQPQEPILTGEERSRRINEWLSEVQKMSALKPTTKAISYQEIADEGGWLPKKPAPYPSTSKSEVLKRLLHDEYARQNYDLRTGDKLIGWVSEDEWRETIEFADLVIKGLKAELVVRYKI